MLQKAISDQILDFVRQKPRTVLEIAQLLQKNWRTADRYVDIISTETGLISVRTFREGSRGALKVVFWNALDRSKGSAYQERLLQKMINNKHKEDFSPFDIYQMVDPNKRKAIIESTPYSTHEDMRFDDLLANAQHQILFFSGNLSWMELGHKLQKTLDTLAKNKVKMKVLTRVDITSQKNTEEMLNINHRSGWDAVEIRHCEQPLRAIIIDDDIISMKEVMSPQFHRELKEKTFIFYLIKDIEWTNWLQKVFWHLWGQSIDAKDRLSALDYINVLKPK